MADHTDVVAAVKNDLLARGVDLAGPCGAFKITSRVAWQLRAEGWGLIHSGGNGCETHGDKFRADTIMLHDGSVIDILLRSESDNGDTSNPANYNIPQWQPTGGQDPGNWRAPFDPGDSPVPIPPGPIPVPVPVPGPAAGCGCAERLDAMTVKLEAMTAKFEAMTAKFEALSTTVDALAAKPVPEYRGSIAGVQVVLHPSH